MNTKKTITIEQVYNIFKKYGDVGMNVNTPYGYKHISACDITAKNSDVYLVETKNKKSLFCSPNHKIKKQNGNFISVCDAKINDIIHTISGESSIEKIQKQNYKSDLYDIQVDEVEQYYSNGIVSHNSSILDSLMFCLFDKTTRCYKGSHVLNVQKTSFKCKLEIEISGVRYFIERTGTSSKTGNVKVIVKFWRIINGVEEELHGNERRDTNDIIRDYIGTYEDFILTTASFQTAKNLTSFIDMGNSERKDLLVQFIGLNIFDRLHESAAIRNKEISVLLKTHKDKNYSHEIHQNQNALDHATTIFNELEKEVSDLQAQIAKLNEEIIIETSKIIPLNEVSSNIVELETNKSSIEESIKKKQSDHTKYNTTLNIKTNALLTTDSEIDSIEKSNLIENHKKYKSLHDEISKCNHIIELKKAEIKGKLDKVIRLDKHEYDPNCKFCNNNTFVIDANKAKDELINDKVEAIKLMSELSILNGKYNEVKWVEKTYDRYTTLLSERGKLKDEISSLNKNIMILTNEIDKLNVLLTSVNSKITNYHRNSVSIEENTKTQGKILLCRNSITKLDIECQKKTRLLMDMSGKKELFKNNIEKLTTIIQEVSNLEDEADSYKLYMESIGRDGIPYQVICNMVPEIEKEVNSILSQIVDYTIQFETDGKNIIPYVVYEYGKWPIELTSGYERFVASIAIRVALTNVSTLPRTTILTIDEGFSTLDNDHLSSMGLLFTILKDMYDFIIVISHNESIKDMVDRQINIKREGSFSKVNYE